MCLRLPKVCIANWNCCLVCFCFFVVVVCLFAFSFFFLQVKMNIKKNNNLCTKTKKQFKQINELRRVGGEGGNLKRK